MKRGLKSSASEIRREILLLARLNGGRLTDEAITGRFGKIDSVASVLADLLKKGIAKLDVQENRRVYLFDDLQAGLLLNICPNCGNYYPVRDEIENCPVCGSDVKMHRSALAKAGKSKTIDGGHDTGVS